MTDAIASVGSPSQCTPLFTTPTSISADVDEPAVEVHQPLPRERDDDRGNHPGQQQDAPDELVAAHDVVQRERHRHADDQLHHDRADGVGGAVPGDDAKARALSRSVS